MERREQHFRRQTAPIVLASNSPRKAWNKNGVESGLPMFQIRCVDFRTQSPGHFDSEPAAFEARLSRLVNKM